MFKHIVKNNIVTISIIIYICIYLLFILIKPGFLFQKNGSLRDFGLGYRNKTIIPIWFLSIFIASLSYFIVMYYVSVS
jgi:hypothetical protein